MRASEPGDRRSESGITRKSSPGAYAVHEPEATKATKLTEEERIAGLKEFHRARAKLGELALELASARASDIVPGVTLVYVGAMAECLQILKRFAEIAEGL